MNTYFKVIDDLKAAAIAEPFVNKVTQGDISDVDLDRSSIYPLCHLSILNSTIAPGAVSLDISVILMDIVDTIAEDTDVTGSSNEMNVINTQLNVASRLHAMLERKADFRETYQLDTPFTCEFFTERFENDLAGVTATFTVTMRNTMTSC